MTYEWITRLPKRLQVLMEGVTLDEPPKSPWDTDDELACTLDPEAWFPEKGGTTKVPRQFCARCPQRPRCLAWALLTGEPYGVYGGMTPQERRIVARAARLTARRQTPVADKLPSTIRGRGVAA